MTEYRMADYRLQDLDADILHRLKHIVSKYSNSAGYDHEFAYYWAKFTDESWLLAILEDSAVCEELYRGKT